MNNQIDEKFTELYESYSKAILDKSFKMIDDYHSAEDIMQETFLKLYKNWSKHKTDEDNKKLLNITSYRLVLNYKRNLKKQALSLGTINYLKALVEEKQRELNPEKIYLYVDFETRVVKKILKLNEPYKGILIYLEIHKIPSYLICKKYGINDNLLRVRAFRAKEVIRDKFCSELEEFYG